MRKEKLDEKGARIAAYANSATMCALLDYSRAQLDRITIHGFIKPLAPNTWSVIETFQGVIRYLRDEGRKTSKSAMQSRVQAARTKEIELRIAERSHIVVEFDECSALVDDVFGNLRAELSGLPSMISRDLKLRDELENHLNEILNRSAIRLQLRAAALGENGKTSIRPISLDTGRMGSEEQDISEHSSSSGSA